MSEIKNCVIENTFFGPDKDGIFTFSIELKGEKWSGQYGLIPLFSSNPEQLLTDLYATIGVVSWEELRGLPIRATIDFEEGKIISIGNLIADKWFDINTYITTTEIDS